MKHHNRDIDTLFVSTCVSIRETIARIDKNVRGIVLVVDQERRLQATVTDGDIRRAILSGVSLDAGIDELLKTKAHRVPLTAPADTSQPDLLALMHKHSVRHIPLVDVEGRI